MSDPINITLLEDGTQITDLTQRTIGVFGVKGSGKTWTLAVIMEELSHQGARYIFLDPIGGMAKKEREGERKAPQTEAYLCRELTATNGLQIAELICSDKMQHLSFQLDLSGLTQPDRISFVEDLCEGLLIHNRSDLILIADEVQNFAPSKPLSGQKLGRGNFTRLCAEGRNRNIGVVIASQRMAKVHADVRELVDAMVFHQLIHSLSLKATEELLRHHVTSEEELDALLSRIQSLGTGHVYIFDPSAINPNRNKGEKPKVQEAMHAEGSVRALDGQESLDKGKPGPEDDEEEEEVAAPAAGKAPPAEEGENLPPPRTTDLFRFDQALAEGQLVEARWRAGSYGEFRAPAQVGKVTREHVELLLDEQVAAGKTSYPKGFRIKLPRYTKMGWGPLNGCFPSPFGKADPREVYRAAQSAARTQGLPARDARAVAEQAAVAAEGRFRIEADTPKARALAREAGVGDHPRPAFTQVIIPSEPAAAQTHMSKHGAPGDEVYVDDDFSPEQLHPLAVHEWTEEHAMRRGLSQQEAHQVANAAERAAAGPEVFEAGVREAQQVAEKARREVGMTWAPRAAGAASWAYVAGKAGHACRRRPGVPVIVRANTPLGQRGLHFHPAGGKASGHESCNGEVSGKRGVVARF